VPPYGLLSMQMVITLGIIVVHQVLLDGRLRALLRKRSLTRYEEDRKNAHMAFLAKANWIIWNTPLGEFQYDPGSLREVMVAVNVFGSPESAVAAHEVLEAVRQAGALGAAPHELADARDAIDVYARTVRHDLGVDEQ
jgi:hypothetical protein